MIKGAHVGVVALGYEVVSTSAGVLVLECESKCPRLNPNPHANLILPDPTQPAK